ncbi:MAG: AAA family ATPase [Bacteroidota bacterium]
MHQLVPRYILDRYLLGKQRGSAPAAAVFMDLSGFSKMTDELARHGDQGAEVLAEVMRAIFEPLVEAVLEQGGFVVGYAGDAFTAVFCEGAEDPPAVRRALACAVRMQEHIRSHPEIQTEFGKFQIFLKAGVGQGSVDWLLLKSADGSRATYCVRGTAVDGAVWAEESALPGEVMLDHAASHALQDSVTTMPQGTSHRLMDVLAELPGPRPFRVDTCTLEEMAPFLPQAILQQALTGEFREVVNLFIEIPVEPHDEAFIAPFMESVFALQERYGGYFLRPELGDKGFTLLLFWGAPAAHENDIERALSFLLELRERTQIQFRAGITYKLAYAGFMGAAWREDYTAYGRGVNLAARMIECAGPGEAWTDSEIARRAGRHFHTRPLGTFSLKGISGPVEAHLLEGRKRLVEIAYRGEFIGREGETEQLLSFMRPLIQGEAPGLLLVRGEAGVGKSRLVHSIQLAPALKEAQIDWAVCRADEILREPFNPLKDWLRQRFHIAEDREAEVNQREFEHNLNALLESAEEPELYAEMRRTASVLAALVNIEQPGSLYEQLDAKGRYDNTMIALSVVLRLCSRQRPLVLLLEDLQWLDDDTRAFFSYFTRTLQADPETVYPIAVLMTSRPEGQLPDMEPGYAVQSLELTSLPSAALLELARDLLGGEVSPALLRLLESRSEGNPFFAEQILRYLEENRLIRRGEDGVFDSSGPPERSVPTDVRALLIARLDRLSREVREVVQTASILGREFEVRLLQSLLNGDPDLPRKMSHAEDADIWFATNEIQYIFRHALLRDAAYSMQLVARQRQLHALAVSAIENLYAGDLNPHLGELAHHAEQARLSNIARSYMLRAGTAAAAAYQNSQAVDYLSRALALTPAGELAARFDLLQQRVDLYRLMGDRPQQLGDLHLLAELAARLQDDARLARLWVRQSSYNLDIGDYPEASRFAVQAIPLARSCGEIDAALMAYSIWSIALLRQGRLRTAMEMAREGLEIAQHFEKREQEASILNSMGMIATEGADAASAMEFLQRALAIARDINDPLLQVKASTNLGNAAGALRGDYAAARKYYEYAYKLLHEWGDRSGEGVLVSNLAWVTGMQGDLDASRAYHRQALIVAREVRNPFHEAYSLINLSAVAGIQGDAQVAADSAHRAYELARKTGDRVAESWSLLNLGHALQLAEEFEQARDAYERCIRLRRELDQPGFDIEPMSGLVEVALQTGDRESALRCASEILAHLERGGSLDGAEMPLRIHFACYQALAEAGDARAQVVLRKAIALLQAQVSNFPDEQGRRMFIRATRWRQTIYAAWQEQEAYGP